MLQNFTFIKLIKICVIVIKLTKTPKVENIKKKTTWILVVSYALYLLSLFLRFVLI